MSATTRRDQVRGRERILMRIGHRDAQARRGENRRIGRVVTDASAIFESDAARLRELAQRGELVGRALRDVANAQFASRAARRPPTCAPK